MESHPSPRDPVPRPADMHKARSRRGWAVATVGLLAIVAAVATYAFWWVYTGRIATVHEGRLYRSAELSADRLTDLCRRYGIRTVVDFRDDPEETTQEADTLAKIGVRYVNLPSDQVPAPGVTAGFLDVMSDSTNLPVLIHCEHGIGRTGLHTAVYRMEFQGWTNEAARWEAMLLAGFDSFQKDTPKGTFLEEYRPSRKQAGPSR